MKTTTVIGNRLILNDYFKSKLSISKTLMHFLKTKDINSSLNLYQKHLNFKPWFVGNETQKLLSVFFRKNWNEIGDHIFGIMTENILTDVPHGGENESK